MTEKNIVLIPAYEPNRILLDLIMSFRANGFQIIVVDDGSGLRYADLFRKASSDAVILRHIENKGKGCAIKTGLSYIKKNLCENGIIVTVDSDGQHRVEDAGKLCNLVALHPDSMVLGSRRLKKNVPLRSQFGNMITRLVYRITTGLKVYDTQTGLRAFSMKLVPELLEISGERYEYEMNVLLEFARRHIPILETEIETIYIDNNRGSHFDTLHDSYRVYKEIIKFSAASFAGFLVDYIIYGLLLFLAVGLKKANIGARIVSATVNYILNRKLVFKNKESIVKSAIQYFLLAAAILAGNTIVLELLVSYGGYHHMFAKLLTELLFFWISWFIQKYIIFNKKIYGIKRKG